MVDNTRDIEKELGRELAQVVNESSDREELSDRDNESGLSDTDNESDYSDSEFEEIDVTDNPLYQVLSAFFETEEGENVCDILKDLSDSVRENTKMMSRLLKNKR